MPASAKAIDTGFESSCMACDSERQERLRATTGLLRVLNNAPDTDARIDVAGSALVLVPLPTAVIRSPAAKRAMELGRAPCMMWTAAAWPLVLHPIHLYQEIFQ
jgi:hypothetical protein